MTDATPLISGTRARICPPPRWKARIRASVPCPSASGASAEDEHARDQPAQRRDRAAPATTATDSDRRAAPPRPSAGMWRSCRSPRTWRFIASSASKKPTAPSPATKPTSGLHTTTRPAPGVAQRVASRFKSRPTDVANRPRTGGMSGIVGSSAVTPGIAWGVSLPRRDRGDGHGAAGLSGNLVPGRPDRQRDSLA